MQGLMNESYNFVGKNTRNMSQNNQLFTSKIPDRFFKEPSAAVGINLTQVDNKDANSTEAKERNFDKSGEEACGNEEGVKSIMKYIMSMDEEDDDQNVENSRRHKKNTKKHTSDLGKNKKIKRKNAKLKKLMAGLLSGDQDESYESLHNNSAIAFISNFLEEYLKSAEKKTFSGQQSVLSNKCADLQSAPVRQAHFDWSVSQPTSQSRPNSLFGQSVHPILRQSPNGTRYWTILQPSNYNHLETIGYYDTLPSVHVPEHLITPRLNSRKYHQIRKRLLQLFTLEHDSASEEDEEEEEEEKEKEEEEEKNQEKKKEKEDKNFDISISPLQLPASTRKINACVNTDLSRLNRPKALLQTSNLKVKSNTIDSNINNTNDNINNDEQLTDNAVKDYHRHSLRRKTLDERLLLLDKENFFNNNTYHNPSNIEKNKTNSNSSGRTNSSNDDKNSNSSGSSNSNDTNKTLSSATTGSNSDSIPSWRISESSGSSVAKDQELERYYASKMLLSVPTNDSDDVSSCHSDRTATNDLETSLLNTISLDDDESGIYNSGVPNNQDSVDDFNYLPDASGASFEKSHKRAPTLAQMQSTKRISCLNKHLVRQRSSQSDSSGYADGEYIEQKRVFNVEGTRNMFQGDKNTSAITHFFTSLDGGVEIKDPLNRDMSVQTDDMSDEEEEDEEGRDDDNDVANNYRSVFHFGEAAAVVDVDTEVQLRVACRRPLVANSKKNDDDDADGGVDDVDGGGNDACDDNEVDIAGVANINNNTKNPGDDVSKNTNSNNHKHSQHGVVRLSLSFRNSHFSLEEQSDGDGTDADVDTASMLKKLKPMFMKSDRNSKQ